MDYNLSVGCCTVWGSELGLSRIPGNVQSCGDEVVYLDMENLCHHPRGSLRSLVECMYYNEAVGEMLLPGSGWRGQKST